MQITIDIPEKDKMARIISEDPLLRAMLTRSYDEVEAWLDANVVTSADALQLLKKVVLLCWYLTRGLAMELREN
jgi:hypothetical protein